MLQSVCDSKMYVGVTNNLKVRFEQHNNGEVHSTNSRRPFKLIYYEASLSTNDAHRRELYLKTIYGKRFIKSRLKSYLTG